MFKLKFDCNSELNPTKRIQLFDWLEDLSNYHCCSQETLILTFQLIDFYCTKSIVSLKEYQLIGAGCLSLANSLVYYALNAFTKQELLDIELRILSTLDWNVNLNQISLELIGLNPPTKIYQLGSDLLVIVLKDWYLVQKYDLTVLAGAVFASCMSCHYLGKEAKRSLLENGFDIETINSAISDLKVFFLQKIPFL